ncbi:hypothetical protein GCM10028773_29680 [Spirosoma koreense]
MTYNGNMPTYSQTAQVQAYPNDDRYDTANHSATAYAVLRIDLFNRKCPDNG